MIYLVYEFLIIFIIIVFALYNRVTDRLFLWYMIGYNNWLTINHISGKIYFFRFMIRLLNTNSFYVLWSKVSNNTMPRHPYSEPILDHVFCFWLNFTSKGKDKYIWGTRVEIEHANSRLGSDVMLNHHYVLSKAVKETLNYCSHNVFSKVLIESFESFFPPLF